MNDNCFCKEFVHCASLAFVLTGSFDTTSAVGPWYARRMRSRPVRWQMGFYNSDKFSFLDSWFLWIWCLWLLWHVISLCYSI